jgi:NAD(P)-dependent dehydrogenase (short-subunit alcohol dehydrogenase family)
MDTLEFAGKVGIVTGASKGIGHAIAQSLSAQGMKLVLVARSQDLLEQLEKDLPSESLVLSKDLRDPTAPAQILTATFEHFGRLDTVVNNAGATKRGDFLELTDADWADGFALKFFGAMRLCRAAWNFLKESRGAIVNIAGVGGRTASAEFTIGGSVNAAVLNLTKALADRGIANGIRVNAINPGSIATERLQTRVQTVANQRGLTQEAAALEMAKTLGISRFGQPEEIANVVAFLLSSRSSYMQGAIVDVDGGQIRTL